jgi:hypothetical protein
MGGKGRGVFSDFRLGRVRSLDSAKRISVLTIL